MGVCLKTMTTILFVGIGGFLGFLASTFIYNLVLVWISSNPAWVYWVTVAACVVLGCILGYYFMKLVFILTTSSFGSYLFLKGIS